MPSGPKKRKAAKKKKEALSIHVDDSGSVSIPSPGGEGSESGGEMASPITPESQEAEAEVAKVETGVVGRSDGSSGAEENGEHAHEVVEEQPTLTQKGEGMADSSDIDAGEVERDMPILKADGDGIVDVLNGANDQDGDTEVTNGQELRKSVYAVEHSCVIQRPVPVIEEVKSLEVPIEKISKLTMLEVKSDEECVEKDEASVVKDSAGGAVRHEEKGLNLSVVSHEEPPPECDEEQLQVGSREAGNKVALSLHEVRKTSWMSCCGLFDAFAGTNR